MAKVNDTDIAIYDYLDILKDEYAREFNKKQNFDDRSGIILTLLGAISIFLFENIKIKEVILMMKEPINFFDFLQISSCLTIYLSFLFTLIMVISTIMVKQQSSFNVKLIKDKKLREERVASLEKIIDDYKEIINNNKELNKKRAKTFKWALIGMAITIISIVIYIAVTQ